MKAQPLSDFCSFADFLFTPGNVRVCRNSFNERVQSPPYRASVSRDAINYAVACGASVYAAYVMRVHACVAIKKELGLSQI